MLGKLVAVWHGIVWYLREISGEARYDHYLEHFAAEHPGETPMSDGLNSFAPARNTTVSTPIPVVAADRPQ